MPEAKNLVFAYEMTPVKEGCGDLIPLEEFFEAVKSHSFVDYDGMGAWATEKEFLDGEENWIYPSDILNGAIPPKWATHVLWYNK